MFYRRKILLALIEKFGGELNRTDCQKLLFLFCKRTKLNYYDFFPYKFGGFSFLSYQDKNRLTALDLLKEGDGFLLNTDVSFFDQLKPKDQELLVKFVLDVKNIRGKSLIKESYLNYPQYACRSTILHEVLAETEINQMKFLWNKDEATCVFSIGYEGISIDAYLDKLVSNNVKALIDVRKNPISMKYGFSKGKLSDYLLRAGLSYFHIPDLGIPSELRKDLSSSTDYEKLFNYYNSDILPTKTEAIQDLKSLIYEHKRVALTCFEKHYHSCHRHKITDHLKNSTKSRLKIVHL